MYYFIPSWHGNQKAWEDNSIVWYRRQNRMNFDDSINHIKMFEAAKKTSNIIVLNYSPNLRTFLHAYELLEVDHFSIFDKLQCITQKEIQKIDFHELNWPEDTNFSYNPFTVIARRQSELLAHIEFGNDGKLIWIDYFNQNSLQKRYIFDDRGFLSSIHFFENQKLTQKIYFNNTGRWVFKEIVDSPYQIRINTEFSSYFKKKEYHTIEELIEEKLEDFFSEKISSDDTIILASDSIHNKMVTNLINGQTLILSLFSTRNKIDFIESELTNIEKINHIICDSNEIRLKLQNHLSIPIQHVSPFDSRLKLGKSQRIKELYIYCLVDNIEKSLLTMLFYQLEESMKLNKNIITRFITYEEDFEKRKAIKEHLDNLIEMSSETFMTFIEDQEESFEVVNDDNGPLIQKPRLVFLHLTNELEVIKLFSDSRIVIDISPIPNLYTQIAAISAGIPQLNFKGTEFVTHLENGYLLKSVLDLKNALPYYLDGLSHWNESLVFAVKKINDYTSGKIVEKILGK
ncbi:accessory Sec system protein Asp1 [Streptococcus uberis]|uniref:accessory Sec system protein Asp1 n=1 Tax=Streptococcus uberis TaxID=1349 RepID=UPI00193AA0B4|nr:accessory Sec system protein Asp1 [Streptococcus uberis]